MSYDFTASFAENFARRLADGALANTKNDRDLALLITRVNADMFDSLAVADVTAENMRATYVDDAAAWRRAGEMILEGEMTFHEAAVIAATSDKPVHELLEIPDEIAENIDAANWKAGSGFSDDSGRREIFRARRTAAKAKAFDALHAASLVARPKQTMHGVRVGDRITFRSNTWHSGSPKLTRVVNDLWDGYATVKAFGFDRFVVKHSEILGVERDEKAKLPKVRSRA